MLFLYFFFNDTATTDIYTLSLHDALPISDAVERSWQGVHSRRDKLLFGCRDGHDFTGCRKTRESLLHFRRDRKSTRLNSSHTVISYAVFCLKKKKKKK